MYIPYDAQFSFKTNFHFDFFIPSEKNFCKYQKFFAWQLDRTMNRNMLNLYHKLLKQNISLFCLEKHPRNIITSFKYVCILSYSFSKGYIRLLQMLRFCNNVTFILKAQEVADLTWLIEIQCWQSHTAKGAVVYMYLTNCKLDLEERNGGW